MPTNWQYYLYKNGKESLILSEKLILKNDSQKVPMQDQLPIFGLIHSGYIHLVDVAAKSVFIFEDTNLLPKDSNETFKTVPVLVVPLSEYLDCGKPPESVVPGNQNWLIYTLAILLVVLIGTLGFILTKVRTRVVIGRITRWQLTNLLIWQSRKNTSGSTSQSSLSGQGSSITTKSNSSTSFAAVIKKSKTPTSPNVGLKQGFKKKKKKRSCFIPVGYSPRKKK